MQRLLCQTSWLRVPKQSPCGARADWLPNIHGEWVIDCLHAETLSIELSKDGRDCVEAVVCVFFHGGLFTKDLRTGLAVSLNVEMSSKTIEGGFEIVEESLGDRVRARSSDGSGGSRDQDKCISEILWLDPKVPIIEVGGISVFNGRETFWKAALRSKAARVALLQDTEWSDHGVGTIRASHTRARCDGEEDL